MAEVKTYYQANEPSDTTVGTIWIQADGTREQRGTDGAWRFAGNVNLDNGGSVKRSGDSMDGALEGAHGLAPLNAPAFTENATLEHEDLSTKPWVQIKLDDLKQFLLEQIASATKQTSTSIALGNSLAFGYGTLNHGEAIAIQDIKYSNNTSAKISEIVLLLPSIKTIQSLDASSGNAHPNWTCSIDPVTLVATCSYIDDVHANENHYGTVNYLVVCMKK